MKNTFWSLAVGLIGCQMMVFGPAEATQKRMESSPKNFESMQQKVDAYALVELKADVSGLGSGDAQMLPFLTEAAKQIDQLFWIQAFGEKRLLDTIKDSSTRDFVSIQYGPWDRLNGNVPFVEGFGTKPSGANFYPHDMTEAEYAALSDPLKTSQYTMLRRDAKGQLKVIPYSVYFQPQLVRISELLLRAAQTAEDQGFKKYLSLRAKDLLRDDYLESDMAWMDMKHNAVDFVVGPIENYEDQRYGNKTAFEAYLLVKDKAWSKKLERFSALMPQLQASLPCAPKYKNETPALGNDMNVYQALYYAGDCNAGSKTIAINLPNDERVQLSKGSRKLQLKNTMQAKFDKILVPIADLLIDPSQRNYIRFDAFFENVMFHEVAHGLGIKNTINNSGSVRSVLKEQYSGIEEAKADILGVYMVNRLVEMKELKRMEMEAYVTFLAGIFRSVRFGVSSAHGRANMLEFNFLHERGAFVRDAKTGLYTVNREKMRKAVAELGGLILTLQGEGNYAGTVALMEKYSVMGDQLRQDLAKVSSANIPKDIRFKQ